MLDATMEEKDVVSHWFQREEEGHAEQLFHTRVIVQERACALTIDQTALINAVSSELVEKLELPVRLTSSATDNSIKTARVWGYTCGLDRLQGFSNPVEANNGINKQRN
jgi:hypothetical protein